MSWRRGGRRRPEYGTLICHSDTGLGRHRGRDRHQLQLETRAGWTIGGDPEYAWTGKIALKAEYLYAFNNTSHLVGTNIFPVGLNYKLW